VISPEGCAAILWKTTNAKDRAAEALRLTAADLVRLNVIDEVLPEPPGGAHEDAATSAATLREAIVRHLTELDRLDSAELRRMRHCKFDRMGEWRELGEDSNDRGAVPWPT
jgi:acetyl-CoA carboxylase carboxyl transferase subunit alpha